MFRLARCSAMLLGLLLIQACQSLPPDHVLRQRMGNFSRMLREKMNPAKMLHGFAADFRNMRKTARKLGGSANGHLRKLRTSSLQILASVRTDAERFPDRLRSRLEDLAQRDLVRFRNLTAKDSTARKILDPETKAKRMVASLRRLPHTLQLDRRILPGPSDPERQTRRKSQVRHEGFFERILRRVFR